MGSTTRATALLIAWLTISLLTACTGDRGASGPDDGSGPLRFVLQEELRIDGFAHDLVPIDTTFRVAVAKDGTIAIAQLQEARVRFFSPDGREVGSVGRRGQGPGEFDRAWRLGWIADTLYAHDSTLRRFTLIDPDLNYVRYVHVPTSARPAPDLVGRIPAFNAFFGGALYADGSVYGQLAQPVDREVGDFDPDKITYGRVDEEGTILSYFQFPDGAGPPVEVRIQEGIALLSTAMFPGPERPILRLSDDGTRMAHLTVSMEGPDAGTYEILMEDVFAGEIYRRRYPFDPRPITPATRDSVLAARTENAPPPIASQLRAHATFPPMFPPVVSVIAGRDSTLWIRMADTPEGRPYRILDPHGEPIGSLLLPHDARIAVADRAQVWVIEKDEFDVESVVRHRLVEAR
jgi:hypothetical protein